MAKTTKCNFCGKELTSTFFTTEVRSLSLGTFDSVDCCEECHNKYAKEVKRIKKRFNTKLENYKKATKQKKLDQETAAAFFLRYLQQEQEQIARCGNITSKEVCGAITIGTDGYFAVHEFGLDTDVTAKQMIKSAKVAEDVGNIWFNKDDITKLEYHTSFVGESLGLFASAYSFAIRLNDEKEMTFKPCITRACFVGKGLFPHTQKRKAKEACAAFLTALKLHTGSDVPVAEVKKFL